MFSTKSADNEKAKNNIRIDERENDFTISNVASPPSGSHAAGRDGQSETHGRDGTLGGAGVARPNRGLLSVVAHGTPLWVCNLRHRGFVLFVSKLARVLEAHEIRHPLLHGEHLIVNQHGVPNGVLEPAQKHVQKPPPNRDVGVPRGDDCDVGVCVLPKEFRLNGGLFSDSISGADLGRFVVHSGGANRGGGSIQGLLRDVMVLK